MDQRTLLGVGKDSPTPASTQGYVVCGVGGCVGVWVCGRRVRGVGGGVVEHLAAITLVSLTMMCLNTRFGWDHNLSFIAFGLLS